MRSSILVGIALIAIGIILLLLLRDIFFDLIIFILQTLAIFLAIALIIIGLFLVFGMKAAYWGWRRRYYHDTLKIDRSLENSSFRGFSNSIIERRTEV